MISPSLSLRISILSRKMSTTRIASTPNARYIPINVLTVDLSRELLTAENFVPGQKFAPHISDTLNVSFNFAPEMEESDIQRGIKKNNSIYHPEMEESDIQRGMKKNNFIYHPEMDESDIQRGIKKNNSIYHCSFALIFRRVGSVRHKFQNDLCNLPGKFARPLKYLKVPWHTWGFEDLWWDQVSPNLSTLKDKEEYPKEVCDEFIFWFVDGTAVTYSCCCHICTLRRPQGSSAETWII